MVTDRTDESAAGLGVESPFRAEYGHFIDGRWSAGESGRLIEQVNPATGAVLGRIQAGSASDVARAVASAKSALTSWSRTPPELRQELLNEMARRIRARAAEYARMESLNNGKTITEASIWDIPNAAATFSYFAGLAHSIHGETQDFADAVAISHREPIGVCAQIIPWNVPLIMAAAKIAPAIVAGNTVVLKPAETTCLTVMEFMHEMSDIIPAGVVNIVTGFGNDVGEALVSHPDVRKVAFTGSTQTGRRILQYASKNLIPQTLELGGKSAQIVCPSADIDAAVEGAAMSTVFNKGEVCLAGSRVFVHESVKDEFLEKLKRTISSIRIGNPLDPATQLGPQASLAQFQKIQSYLQIAASEGAVAAVGGTRASVPGFPNGFFIQPTIYDGVRQSMRIAREEIFGPVTAILEWTDESEVIAAANDSEYGLAGGIWTRDLTQAHRIARALETGTVWVNRYFNFRLGMALGGYKHSGFGREFAREILDAYTVTKSVVINLSEGKLGVFG